MSCPICGADHHSSGNQGLAYIAHEPGVVRTVCLHHFVFQSDGAQGDRLLRGFCLFCPATLLVRGPLPTTAFTLEASNQC